MATGVELKNNPQAAWRVDPLKTAAADRLAISVPAYHLAGYVTGLKAQSVLADLATFVEGRALDDNAHVLIRYEGGARGMLWSSQVAIGCANALRLRYLAKRQFDLVPGAAQRTGFTPLEGVTQIIKRGRADLDALTQARTRTPPGHPEGYIEAFSNLYSSFAAPCIAVRRSRRSA